MFCLSWGKSVHKILCIPRTQLTSMFERQPSKTRPFAIKTRVSWVVGIYEKMYGSWWLGESLVLDEVLELIISLWSQILIWLLVVVHLMPFVSPQNQRKIGGNNFTSVGGEKKNSGFTTQLYWDLAVSKDPYCGFAMNFFFFFRGDTQLCPKISWNVDLTPKIVV